MMCNEPPSSTNTIRPDPPKGEEFWIRYLTIPEDLTLGGNTVISNVVLLVKDQPLGPYMSCTIILDHNSGSESAIFYNKIHYFDGYFAHFFRANFGALF